MKVSELFEVLGPKKSETFDGITIFDPNNGEYNEGEKDGPNSYVGLRSDDKSARSKAILKAIFDKRHIDGVKDTGIQWIDRKAAGGGLVCLFTGKLSPAIARAKKMITAHGKEYDKALDAKDTKTAMRRELGPSIPSASAEARKAMVAKYGADVVRRVTVKQVGGDDGYQWAILVDGRVRMGGLTKREVPYHRENTYKALAKKETK